MAGSESSTKSPRVPTSAQPGSDLRRGDLAVAAGTVIGPAHVGLLASVDATRVTVHARPKVGVLSTGDELVGGTVPLELGQIRDSNRQGLLAALQRDGFVGIDLGVRRDDEAAISAGDSRGGRALRCSAHLRWGQHGRVRLREGRPGGLGGRARGPSPSVQGRDQAREAVVVRGRRSAGGRLVPVFGLPGNPVSSMVSYQVVALPVLRKLAGHRSPLPRRIPAVAADDFERRPDGKLHLVRVVAAMGADGRIIVRSAGEQGSHQLAALAAANALALVPNGDRCQHGKRSPDTAHRPARVKAGAERSACRAWCRDPTLLATATIRARLLLRT